MGMTCTVCRHPRLAEIDSALARGETERAIASQFNLRRASVQRHKNHAGQLDARAKEAAVSAMDHARWHMANLRKIAEDCVVTPREYLVASREFSRAAELLGRFSGQLQSPTVIAFISGVGARDEAEIRRWGQLARGSGEVSIESAREDALELVALAMRTDAAWAAEVRSRLVGLAAGNGEVTNGHGSHAEEVA